MELKSGNRYSGGYADDKRNGYGVFEFKQGWKYEG